MSGNSPQFAYPSSLLNVYTIAFEGNSIACILYGVYIVIAGMNLVLLDKKRHIILLYYSIVQLVLTTLYVAISLYASPAQGLALFNIIDPYDANALSPWPGVVVDSAFIMNTWVSDSFLLYRCYAVYMGNKYALALPVLLYLAAFGSSLAWLIITSTPGTVYSPHALQLTVVCYWSCSAAVNVCASFLISARLWMYRQAISRAIGSQHGAFYLGYIAMTLESALLYTVFVVAVLVVISLNSPLQTVFLPVVGTIQAISPSLIIYRIARGISFGTDECRSMSTMQFSTHRQRAIIRPDPERLLNTTSPVTHVSSGDITKTEHSSFSSFIQEVERKV